jgi:hypothetical protein
MAKVRALAVSMRPGEREGLDSDAITMGMAPESHTFVQAAFNFDQLPQLEAEMEKKFRRIVCAMADALKKPPQVIKVPADLLLLLEEICDLKGTRLPTIFTLMLNQATMQLDNKFLVLTDEQARQILARQRQGEQGEYLLTTIMQNKPVKMAFCQVSVRTF